MNLYINIILYIYNVYQYLFLFINSNNINNVIRIFENTNYFN